MALSLPTFGYGAGDPILVTFGYGGTGASLSSEYDATGKKLVRITPESSGPVIMKLQSDDTYLGLYNANVVAKYTDKILSNLSWQFYGEVVSAVSGTTKWYSLIATSLAVATDKFGKARVRMVFEGSLALGNFYDQTGTTGGRISIWAEDTTSEYITQRLPLQYRVIETAVYPPVGGSFSIGSN